MIEDGELAAFRTRGGHLRVAVEGVRAAAGESPVAESARRPSAVLQNRRERVEELALEAQEIRAKHEIERLQHEAAAEGQRYQAEADALRRESEREAQAIALEREQTNREQVEADERRRLEREERQRRATFLAGWTAAGLRAMPAGLLGELQCELRARLSKALSQCDPAEPDYEVQRLVLGIVSDVVGPWKRRQDLNDVIRRAVASLPLFMSGFADSLTEWGLKAKQAASEAIGHLPEDSDINDCRAAAQAAVSDVRARFECQQNRESLLEEWRLSFAIVRYLEELLSAGEVELEGSESVSDAADSLLPDIRRQLAAELTGRETEAEVRQRIRELVRADLHL